MHLQSIDTTSIFAISNQNMRWHLAMILLASLCPFNSNLRCLPSYHPRPHFPIENSSAVPVTDLTQPCGCRVIFVPKDLVSIHQPSSIRWWIFHSSLLKCSDYFFQPRTMLGIRSIHSLCRSCFLGLLSVYFVPCFKMHYVSIQFFKNIFNKCLILRGNHSF